MDKLVNPPVVNHDCPVSATCPVSDPSTSVKVSHRTHPVPDELLPERPLDNDPEDPLPDPLADDPDPLPDPEDALPEPDDPLPEPDALPEPEVPLDAGPLPDPPLPDPPLPESIDEPAEPTDDELEI